MTKTIPIFSRNNARDARIAGLSDHAPGVSDGRAKSENDQSPITNHQSRPVPARLHFSPVLVFLASVFFAAALQAAPLSQDEITDLVKRLETVYQNRTSLQANFREERHMAILKDPVINEGKIWFTPPDNIRREITGNSPSTTVIDGKKMTIYYPNLKTAEQYDLEKRPIIRQSLQALTAGLNFQRVGDYYNIEGTKEGNTYVITLTPKAASIRRLVKSLTLTMQTDLTPEKVDYQSPRGERVLIDYSNVKRDPVPESQYEFNPPVGTNVTNPFGS
jgi:outer membrane lipoprotein-sorting protein